MCGRFEKGSGGKGREEKGQGPNREKREMYVRH